MKTIRISDGVWDEIVRRGKFGETSDDVLRRVFGIEQAQDAAESMRNKVRKRFADRKMSARLENGQLVVEFYDGPSGRWTLPPKNDKNGIRAIRDQAVEFAKKNGGTLGQMHAVMKALTDKGYHLTK